MCGDLLEQSLRKGAQQMLQSAIEAGVSRYIQSPCEHLDEDGHRLVRRNGRKTSRELQTSVGPITLQQPRVDDRRPGHQFTSNILPRYLRRVASLDNLIPALYLRGVSTNNMRQALEPILSDQVRGLSPANVTRICSIWEDQQK